LHRTRNDILISGVLVILFLWFVWEARDWPFRTRFFPWAIGFPVLGLAAIQFGLSIWAAFRAQPAEAVEKVQGKAVKTNEMRRSLDASVMRQRTVSIAAWAVCFALGLWILGFKVGGLLLSAAFLRLQAHETWLMSLGYGLAVYLFFFVGLEKALAFALPPGLLAASLGLQSFDSYLVNPLLNLFSGSP